MKRNILIITSILTAIMPVTQAHAQEPITISQGDLFHTTRGEKVGDPQGKESNMITINCTIGYIDHNLHRAYTAGHCGLTGNNVTNDKGDIIGVFYKNPRYNEKTYRNDQAYIQLNKNIILGRNYYSGDNIVSLQDVSTSDTLCSYGSSSKEIHCGNLRTVDERNIVGDNNTGGIPGDSGGPAWIPNKGLIGVFSASYFKGKDDNKEDYAHVFNSIYGESSSQEDSDVTPLKKYDKGKYSYDLKQMIDTAYINIQGRSYKNIYNNMKKKTSSIMDKISFKF